MPCTVLVFPFTFSGATTYVAFRAGDRGWVLVSQGTTALTVIQSAINALTVGRTWQETIVLKGNLGNVYNVTLANYTRLLGVSAQLTLPTGQTYLFMQANSDLTDVTIDGIYFKCQTSYIGVALFFWYNSTGRNAYSILVQNCVFDSFYDGIHIICQRSIFSQNNFTNCVTGIYEDAGNVNDIEGNVFRIPDRPASASALGIRILDGYENRIRGNTFMPLLLTWTGILYGIIVPKGTYLLLIANNSFFALSGSGCGIYIGSENINRDMTIESNHFYDIGNGVIRVGLVASDSNIHITNNIAFNFNTGTFLIAGAGGTSPTLYVQNNIIRNFTYRCSLAGAGYQIYFKNNIFSGIGLADIVGTGTLVYKQNIGWITENTVLSPAFAIDAAALITVTIPHGLAITPTIGDCSLTIVEDTDVDDWGYNLLKVDNVGAVNVVAKVNISVASATGGATAKLSLRVGKA